MTPYDMAAIRAYWRDQLCGDAEDDRYSHDVETLAGALEAAWAERDEARDERDDWKNAHAVVFKQGCKWRTRAERAEAERELFRTQAHLAHEDWMQVQAALARVRALCDGRCANGYWPTVAEIRAAIEGGAR